MGENFEQYVPPITIHRLFVIEWLGDDDQKTGTELVRHLLHRKLDLKVELVSCKCKGDVLAAIAQVEAEVPTLGFPILHIEAHGYDIEGEGMGFRGPNPGGNKPDVILWQELEEPFRSLNLATRFNLLVVVAACLSDTALFTLRQDRLAPFALVMGLSTKISWSSLERAMKAFYDAFLIANLTFLEAFIAARNQINLPIERIGFTPIARLVKSVVREIVALQSPKAKFENLYLRRNALRRYNGQPHENRADTLRAFDELMARSIDQTASTMLGYDVMPENRERFKFDAGPEALRAFRSRVWS